MLEHLIYGNFGKQVIFRSMICEFQTEPIFHNRFDLIQDIHPTIEDIYAAVIDTDRGTKEGIRFYDTEGFPCPVTDGEIALPKHYHSLADAFVLVYSIENRQSFEIIDLLKKDIEKNREKKEVISVHFVGITV